MDNYIPLGPVGLYIWVQQVIDLCDEGQEDAALKVIASVTQLFKDSNMLDSLDRDLLFLPLKKLPTIVLVDILRNTFSMRDGLPNWYLFRDDIAKELQLRGADQSIMQGLLDG